MGRCGSEQIKAYFVFANKKNIGNFYKPWLDTMTLIWLVTHLVLNLIKISDL